MSNLPFVPTVAALPLTEEWSPVPLPVGSTALARHRAALNALGILVRATGELAPGGRIFVEARRPLSLYPAYGYVEAALAIPRDGRWHTIDYPVGQSAWYQQKYALLRKSYDLLTSVERPATEDEVRRLPSTRPNAVYVITKGRHLRVPESLTDPTHL